MSDSEDTSSAMQEPDPDVQPYVDAADRLERTLDAQLQTIRNIDSRAGFIIRVVGILLGVIVSAASILATVSTNDGGRLVFSVVAVVTALVAMVGLLGAMVAAIITYLSSNPTVGLEYQTANLLSSPEYETDLKTHLRRTLGVYAYDIQKNAEIIQTNAARFRLALVLLVVGVIYGTLTAAFVVAQLDSIGLELVVFVGVTIVAGVLVWYVLTERYKVAESEEESIHE